MSNAGVAFFETYISSGAYRRTRNNSHLSIIFLTIFPSDWLTIFFSHLFCPDTGLIAGCAVAVVITVVLLIVAIVMVVRRLAW